MDNLKRQAPTNTTGSPLVLSGEAFRLIEQFFTVLYSVGVINSGADLGETCLQVRSANAILGLTQVGLNATQAAAIICAASLPDSDLAAFNETLIASAASGLYAVQIAANFTGTVNTSVLCNHLDLSPLPAVGVDVDAVQNFVCNANNSTATTAGANNTTSIASITLGASTGMSSVGTLTPFPFTNSSEGTYTWVGSITVKGPGGTAVTSPWGTSLSTSGTGVYPTGNLTAVAPSAGSGIGMDGTGSLPTGTGNLPAATGNAAPGTAVNGTGNIPAGTGPVGTDTGASATGDVSSGYASPSTDTESSTGSYGEETSERFPRGPTSTPRYYPKYS